MNNELKENETRLLDTNDYITTAYEGLPMYKCEKCGCDDLLDKKNYCSNCGRKVVHKLNNQLSNLFITIPRQFGRTKSLQLVLYYEMCYTYGKELVDRILEEQDCSIDEIGKYINKVDEEHIYYYDMRHFRPNIYDGASISFRSLYNIIKDCADEYVIQAQPSLDDQITSIKSQLKHCKNPLQKLNLEREMNRLIKEGRKCK